MRYIGIDIGGTYTKAGLVDENGRILESRRSSTDTGNIQVLLSTLSDIVR